MYCPKCGAEYLTGYTKCADCEVPLIKNPPTMPIRSDFVELMTVLYTRNQATLLVAESLLKTAGIKYVIIGDGLMDIYGLGYTEIKVNIDQAEEAKELLADMQ